MEDNANSQKNKKMFDLIVANAREFIHAQENSDRILKSLQSANPAKVAGQQAGIILSGIIESAVSKGINPPASVVIAAAVATISEIVDLGVAGGVLKKEQVDSQQFQQEAMQEFKRTIETDYVEKSEPQQEESVETPVQESSEPGQESGVLGRSMGGM